MTITLTPDQERILREQLNAGRYKSVDEVIDRALAALEDVDPVTAAKTRERAIQRMLEFGKEHRLSLNGVTIKELVNEGRKY